MCLPQSPRCGRHGSPACDRPHRDDCPKSELRKRHATCGHTLVRMPKVWPCQSLAASGHETGAASGCASVAMSASESDPLDPTLIAATSVALSSVHQLAETLRQFQRVRDSITLFIFLAKRAQGELISTRYAVNNRQFDSPDSFSDFYCSCARTNLPGNRRNCPTVWLVVGHDA